MIKDPYGVFFITILKMLYWGIIQQRIILKNKGVIYEQKNIKN